MLCIEHDPVAVMLVAYQVLMQLMPCLKGLVDVSLHLLISTKAVRRACDLHSLQVVRFALATSFTTCQCVTRSNEV